MSHIILTTHPSQVSDEVRNYSMPPYTVTLFSFSEKAKMFII